MIEKRKTGSFIDRLLLFFSIRIKTDVMHCVRFLDGAGHPEINILSHPHFTSFFCGTQKKIVLVYPYSGSLWVSMLIGNQCLGYYCILKTY